MVVKAVEMVRKIRNRRYEETRNRSVDEQIKIIKKESDKLQRALKKVQRSTVNNTA